MIGICSYFVLDRPVFEWNEVLLHPELTLWWSFLSADGAHHKKPDSPTHPLQHTKGEVFKTKWCHMASQTLVIIAAGNGLPPATCHTITRTTDLLTTSNATSVLRNDRKYIFMFPGMNSA